MDIVTALSGLPGEELKVLYIAGLAGGTSEVLS